MDFRVLVADDDPGVLHLLEAYLRREGWGVIPASDGIEALERFEALQPELAVLDVAMPHRDGLQVLAHIIRSPHPTPVIMLSGQAEPWVIIAAMKGGATDFLLKPILREDFLEAIRRHRKSNLREIEEPDPVSQDLLTRMGRGMAVRRMLMNIQRVAATDFSVLIQGETGTGKELVAEAIHRMSRRAGQPLVAVDCGAIPDTLLESELFGHERGAFTGATSRRRGYFELARGGTLFLDEITNLHRGLQAKLLRALEERHIWPVGAERPVEVDVRIVAASNSALRQEVEGGRFRRDVYQRLAEFEIFIPPLRERREDIEYLAERLLAEACRELDRPPLLLSPEARALLVQEPWPGNVRELRNAIRRAAILVDGSRIDARDLERPRMGQALSLEQPALPTLEQLVTTLEGGRPFRLVMEELVGGVERDLLVRLLEWTRGNKRALSRLLQMNYRTLFRRLREHGI
ncbi:MAG: sigma-54-dependent Fis family transcriptional regulator [Candidatus Rokubacteria bacterium]|nr:sigma-54-dependent Fis family transcriptional regulator [Deltaproteobacteria bacterium]MBI3077066.1 sigma-54-dependent Fis family transcriptional regulator [Deltaproteobacteria bacterium]MBI4611602.1 sigma-54-dependent Fis family transcriptional regulator [Candidatus Rokubacteria bacterium]